MKPFHCSVFVLLDKIFSNFLFAVLLLPSAQSLPWELVKLCVDTIIPFDNGVVERSTKCCYEQMDHEHEKKMSEDTVETMFISFSHALHWH